MKDYHYEYEHDRIYCYPGTDVLVNKLEIRNRDDLFNAERDITGLRLLQMKEKPVRGKFDFNRLLRIHKRLFDDLYPWAGKIRTVNISKGNQFCLCQNIMQQMTELMNELLNENCLADYKDKKHFSERLAYYLSEINAIHPFREGNGRTQREFIRELAWHDGWLLDLSDVTQDEMIEASVESFNKDYGKMTSIIFCNIKERKRKTLR